MKTLNLEPASSRYGASMGRRDSIPADYNNEKLRLTRLRWVDGDYDQGGAYWGAGNHGSYIWCAWGETETEQVRIYIRAPNRETAKRKVRERVEARFFR